MPISSSKSERGSACVAGGVANGLTAPSLQVLSVFPSASSVPENLLRFHVFFNQPPAVDRVLEAVRVIDDNGAEVPHPFLDLQGGLWDASGTRLTVLLHPGRLKSGLLARERLGPALSFGRRYQIEINLALLADGPMKQTQIYSKTFGVQGPLVDAVHPWEWRLHSPRRGTRDSLRVDFNRPVDRLALESGLLIRQSDDTLVEFSLQIAHGEQAAYLTPEAAWQAAPYRLLVSPELEDVAGNQPGGSFETRGDYQQAAATDDAFKLTFNTRKDV